MKNNYTHIRFFGVVFFFCLFKVSNFIKVDVFQTLLYST